MKESYFQTKIVKRLEAKKAIVLKYNASALSKTGVSDLIVCLDGLYFAIEVKKSEKDAPTELQKHFIKKINQSGGVACVLRPEKFTKFCFLVDVFLLDKRQERVNEFRKTIIEKIGIE